MSNYIETIEFDKNYNMYAKFENGKVFHKIKILNAPNLCGMHFKIYKRTITEYNDILDFAYILEKLLTAPITHTIYERIKNQLQSLNYNIITSNNIPLF